MKYFFEWHTEISNSSRFEDTIKFTHRFFVIGNMFKDMYTENIVKHII